MKWHYLSEEERVKNVYSKYSIDDFWNWWSNKEEVFMEVRIMDWKLVKTVAKKFKLPFSSSGIYVKTANELKLVMKETRDKAKMWFAINPRKKNYNKRGWKSFEGKDENVDTISYLLVDIDRLVKERAANNKELENCDEVTKLVLDRMAKNGWDKDYIKICSGNGVQLLISLDVPIKMPEVEFDNETKTFIHNEEFDTTKYIFKNGIGKQLENFSRKFKNELGVEIDKSCFLIGKVAALPFSKNFKHKGFTWRGLLEIKKGENTGFTDYLLTSVDDVVEFKGKNPFSNRAPTIGNKIREGKLKQNKLAKLLLEGDFPEGGINNSLWFQLKLLLRDSKYNVNSKEFILYHSQLKQKHGRGFSINIPDKKYFFNEMTVNNYCLMFGLEPIYKLWPKRNKKLNMCLDKIKWEDIKFATGKNKFNITNTSTLFEDLDECKKQLKERDYLNIDKVLDFINECIKKYGEVKTKMYFDNGIFIKYFSYE